MSRYWDIDPMDIDPETGQPYSNYSSPSLDTSFHDNEMDVDDPCRKPWCPKCAAEMAREIADARKHFISAYMNQGCEETEAVEAAERYRTADEFYSAALPYEDM